MFDKVLVGVDGRSTGRDAIALTSRLAASLDRPVLTNVYGTYALGGLAEQCMGQLRAPPA